MVKHAQVNRVKRKARELHGNKPASELSYNLRFSAAYSKVTEVCRAPVMGTHNGGLVQSLTNLPTLGGFCQRHTLAQCTMLFM